jgi:hypothetical protein
VVDAIHQVNGLAVASHVDRERFGIIGQLGMIPPDLPLDALEVSQRMPLPAARAAYAAHGKYPLLCASDAHDPKDVGRAASWLYLEAPTLSELRQAFSEHGGRMVLGGGKPMEDLALHILDIVQNSVGAGATRIEITLLEDLAADQLVFEVIDNGSGMDQATLARLTDPFFTTRTTRRVGMGLPLLAEAARAADGKLDIDSSLGKGSSVRATFRYSHIDRAPVGDIETTLMVLFAGHSDLEISFRHVVGARSYKLDSREWAVQGLTALRQAIRSGEASLKSM